jgi:ribosomal 50S subunit-recycling heat shock protein
MGLEGTGLRVDLFLKLMGITKTRMAAKRLCDMGKVLLQGKPLKPSHEIIRGDILDVFLPQKEIQIRALEIPAGSSVAKRDRRQFHELLSSKEL